MIIRYRNRPLPLQMLDALIPRLPSNHPQLKDLRIDAAKLQKGYNGERKLDYHIEGLSDDFTIMADVCFSLHNKQTQIDSLIVSDHAIFIVEVKSFTGIITFDTTLRQCYRDIEGDIERYKYPITQVQTVQANLLRFLQIAKQSGLPIYYFVAFSERSTYIKVKGEENSLKNIVTYVEDIPHQVRRLNEELASKHPIEKSSHSRNKVVQHIMRNCEDFMIDIMKKYQIHPSEILSGVQCPQCNFLGMKRKTGNWYCPSCSATCNNAHEKALQDFKILFNETLTNPQCRQFLQLNSRHTTKYILQQSQNIKQATRYKWTIVK